MSDGSNTFKCIVEPYKTVGAQDLLKIGYQYYGHLRKRGKRDNYLASLSSSLSLKWRQKFVILSQGCIYCYGNEFSKSPSAAFSLSVYESVKEIGDQANMLHCFEVQHEDRNKAPHLFACETDQKRKEWISHIRESIDQSHKISQGSLHSEGGGSDEGIVIQSPVKRNMTRNLPPLPKIPPEDDVNASGGSYKSRSRKPESEYDLGDEDDLVEDVEYNDVDESTFSQPPSGSPTFKRGMMGIGLPGLADLNLSDQRQSYQPFKSSPTHSNPANRPAVPLPRPKKQPENRESMAYEDTEPTKPRVGPKPLHGMHSNTFPPDSYLFDSSDKELAKDTLSSKPDGTFLLRNGRQDKDKKVLSVKTALGIKEFQIQQKDGQMTLNNQEKFGDLDKLLLYYRDNNLPKNEYQQKLVKGYRS